MTDTSKSQLAELEESIEVQSSMLYRQRASANRETAIEMLKTMRKTLMGLQNEARRVTDLTFTNSKAVAASISSALAETDSLLGALLVRRELD